MNYDKYFKYMTVEEMKEFEKKKEDIESTITNTHYLLGFIKENYDLFYESINDPHSMIKSDDSLMKMISYCEDAIRNLKDIKKKSKDIVNDFNDIYDNNR